MLANSNGITWYLYHQYWVSRAVFHSLSSYICKYLTRHRRALGCSKSQDIDNEKERGQEQQLRDMSMFKEFTALANSDNI